MTCVGGRCPLVTKGHSLLERCGNDIFSLDEFWESCSRADGHFWRAFSIVAERVRDFRAPGTSQIGTFIDGATIFAQSSVNPLTGSVGIALSSMKLPAASVAGTVLHAFMGGVPGGAISITASPLLMAKYTYLLVSGWVSKILPILLGASSISAPSVAREILHVMSNHLFDSRKDFETLVIQSMHRGCSGMSLMMGYSNPWAVFVRKQCETIPAGINGTLTVLLSVTVVIPFVECICVGAPGAAVSFERYAMDNCYYFAPTYLKGFVLKVIEGARNGGGVKPACRAMVDLAKADMAGAFQPWFTSQFQGKSIKNNRFTWQHLT